MSRSCAAEIALDSGAVAAADRVIRWSTPGVVLGVAAVASVVSYCACERRVAGARRVGVVGRLIPLTVEPIGGGSQWLGRFHSVGVDN